MMATGSVDINRYVDCNGRQILSKSVSFSASARTNVTGTTMGYTEIPTGYKSICNGLYLASLALLPNAISPNNVGSSTLLSIRNVSTSAQNSKSTGFAYTFIREDMIEDQRSLTTYDNTGITSSTGNIAIQPRKLLWRRYKGSIASLAANAVKRILPGNMTPAYYIPTGYLPIAITNFSSGSTNVVIDYILPKKYIINNDII